MNLKKVFVTMSLRSPKSTTQSFLKCLSSKERVTLRFLQNKLSNAKKTLQRITNDRLIQMNISFLTYFLLKNEPLNFTANGKIIIYNIARFN